MYAEFNILFAYYDCFHKLEDIEFRGESVCLELAQWHLRILKIEFN
jgi:hypothetical protein